MSAAPGLVAVGISAAIRDRVVVRDVSIAVPPGQLLAVIGPNGAGKTSLLRCLAGLLELSSGSVRVDGQDILSVRSRERALRIAYLPQVAHVDFPFTALDVVLMGRHPHLRWLDAESPRDLEIAHSALKEADAGEWGDRPVTELSGGERRRVFFARALAQQAQRSSPGRADGRSGPPARTQAPGARARPYGRIGRRRAPRSEPSGPVRRQASADGRGTPDRRGYASGDSSP